MQRKKKRRSTCRIRRNNTAVSTGVLKARHLWTNLALSCVAGTHSFEKQYKSRLMQNQAMEITAGRAMRHRAILGDFASPDSQIAMETSIIGCRIARFCFSVTGLLAKGMLLLMRRRRSARSPVRASVGPGKRPHQTQRKSRGHRERGGGGGVEMYLG